VEAARRGGFGLVLGVDRRGHAEALAAAGADLVVADLADVAVEPAGPGRARTVPRVQAPLEAPPRPAGPDAWTWSYDGIDEAQEGVRETLCTLGNGYFATRGAAPWARQDDVHYPGTYVAGCYNRLTTEVAGESLENESLVNLPNWLDLLLRVEDGEWLGPEAVRLSAYRQELDLRRGLLRREARFEDHQGRRTAIVEWRIVSMDDPHLAAQQVSITAENWSGRLCVRAGLDARVANLGVHADRGFASQHLVPAGGAALGPDAVKLAVETSRSRIRVVEACRVRAVVEGRAVESERRPVVEAAYAGQELTLGLDEGATAVIEKVAAHHTSRDPAVSEPGLASAEAVRQAGGFDELLGPHQAAWERLWARFRLDVDEEHANRILRLHAFHLLRTLSRRTMELDVGVPARGLHGEGYRGHVFWDEMMVLPLLTYRLPELTRELLRYRYRRLGAARRLASQEGCAGAMFPWQSGSDGREETPTRLFNPRSGRWMRDNSRLQRHVSLAVAYNVWHYYEVAGDVEFLANYGAELLVEIARLFASLAVYNPAPARYEIRGAMGPDEYHDAYPGADRPGIDNNAYTNVMVV
jgi:trehalose/maltose hydrolase-like predicted phosphorylase